MDNDKELEKLIEKSRIQIEEREKVLKELMSAREADRKQRALEQLTNETAQLQNESKRLKELIELNNQTLTSQFRTRGGADSNRTASPEHLEREAFLPPRPNRFESPQQPREEARNRSDDQSKFNEALLEVTREIKAELARQRSAAEEARSQKSSNEEALYQELKALREEVKTLENTRSIDTASISKGISNNTVKQQERDFAIDELQNEIQQIQAELAKAQSLNKNREELEAANANLTAETRRIRTDLDRQKVDNFKRDRDMTRVINLLEKLADEDEE